MTFNINTLQVGQEVAIAHSGSWETSYQFGYKVASMTPKRTKIVVKRVSDGHQRSFNGAGVEVGTYCKDELRTNVAQLKQRVEIRTARMTLSHEISQIGANSQLGTAPSLASMQGVLDQMENQVAAARAKLAALAKKIEAVE